MKKTKIYLMLITLNHCIVLFSMPPAVQDKTAKEKAGIETINTINQFYDELATELKCRKPDSVVVASLGTAIAQEITNLPLEQKVNAEHAPVNAQLTKYQQKNQRKLLYLAENGNNAVKWLLDIANNPSGTFSNEFITGIIRKGRQFYSASIEIDCSITLPFVPSFYQLLQHPHISPFVKQSLQP